MNTYDNTEFLNQIKVGSVVKNIRTGSTFEIISETQLTWFLGNSYSIAPSNYQLV